MMKLNKLLMCAFIFASLSAQASERNCFAKALLGTISWTQTAAVNFMNASINTLDEIAGEAFEDPEEETNPGAPAG